MSALTIAPGRRASDETGAVRDAVRAEWLKLRTVRSSFWTLGGSAFAMIAFAVIGCAVLAAQYAGMSAQDRLAMEPISFSLGGSSIAQMLLSVLGVLFVTSEYSSGLIRTTFTSVPQRSRVVLAKGVVLAASTWVLMTVFSFIAFFVGQAFMSSTGAGASLWDDAALRMTIGCGIYLAICTLFGMGIGLIIRHTGGAVSAVFGLTFLVPGLLQLVPEGLRDTLDKYSPGVAGRAMFNVLPDPALLSPWAGLAVFALWTTGFIGLGVYLLDRRDA